MEVPAGESPAAEDTVVTNLLFLPVARGYAAAFFGTMLLAGIATFSAVEWSAETDKIILYYGFLNPCVLFDHYPAKVVAMTGMSFFILIGIMYDVMVFFQSYCERKMSNTVWTGVVVWTVTLIHMAFVNVFVTNLYPMQVPLERRLHGVHHGLQGAVSLVEQPLFVEETNSTLTHAEIDVIELHTAFYIVWLLGEIWFLTLLVQMQREYILSRPLPSKIGYGLFCTLAMLGMGMHAAAMLVIILQDRPKVEWYFREELQNSVQWAIIYIDAKLLTSAWGWIPVMFYRWVFAAGRGVRITMSLKEKEGDDGGIMPEWWVGRALQATSVVLVAGGAFVGTWEQDNTTFFRLASALRSKPFAYFGAPVLLGSFVFAGVGIFFTCAQRRLMQGRMNWCLNITGLVMFFSLLGCMLVVLDQERFTFIFLFTAVGSYCAWVIQLCKETSLCSGLAYCVTGGVLLAAARVTNIWVLHYTFLVWLCCYNPVVPDGAWLYVKVSKIVDDDMNYLPLGAQTQGPPVLNPAVA